MSWPTTLKMSKAEHSQKQAGTNASNLKRLHATVEGYVQGVGFRNYVQDTALRLDLTGWVRNTPDGSVEVTAEGPEAALHMLVNELHHGPRASQVTRVNAEWSEASHEFTRFKILFF